jgi:predicted permease
VRLILTVWWRVLELSLAALTPRIPDHMRLRWHAEWSAELVHERERLATERLTITAFGTLVRLPWGMIADAAAVRRYFSPSGASTIHKSREFLMLRDLRLAWRSLIRSPGFTVSAVLTLSLGLGANAGIFHLLHGVALRPLPYSEPQELVALKSLVPGNVSGTEWRLSVAGYFHFRENAEALEGLAAYGIGESTLMGDGAPVRISYAQSSANLPALLGARPALGRLFVDGEDRRGAAFVAMLGHDFWQNRFGGDSSVVGRGIDIDGTMWTVVGVLPRGFDLPNETIDVWVAWHALNPGDVPRNSHFLRAIGRLAPGATVGELQTQLDQLTARFPEIFPEAYSQDFMDNFGFRTVATPLLDDVAGQTADTLWVLLGSVGLVLLLAAANVTNLVLVRSETRAREVALRQALGASPWDLARQYLAEGIWIAMIGGVLGTALGLASLQALIGLAPVTLPRLQSGLPPIGSTTIVFMIVLSGAAALLFGMMPLVRGRSATALDATRGTTGERHGSTLRNVLVATQVAIGLVLIVAAASTLATVQRLRNTDPGFNPENLMTFDIQLPQSRYESQESVARFLQDFLDRAEAIPGVVNASATSGLPLVSSNTCVSSWFESRPLQPSESPPCVTLKFVAPEYFRTMGIPLIRGQESTPADNEQRAGAAVVSRALAESIWPSQSPIGQGFNSFNGPQEPWYRVVGVTDDLLQNGLDSPAPQLIFMPLRSVEGLYSWVQLSWQVVIRTDASGAPGLRNQLETMIAGVDRNILVSTMASMTDIISRSMAPLSFVMVLLGIAAALALALGFVGIYGVIAYLVARRRAEIGVRLALGARVSQVQSLVIGHSLKLAGAGIAVGVVGTLLTGRLVQRFAFEADPAGPLTIGVVAVLLLGAAVVASYLPSRRAALIDPSEALRGG